MRYIDLMICFICTSCRSKVDWRYLIIKNGTNLLLQTQHLKNI